MTASARFPELIALDALEGMARDVCMQWFAEHALEEFSKRMREGTYTGVGSQRLLLHTWYELLEGDVERLVDFYGGCTRPQDDPHYEDLVTTILLGIAIGLTTNLIWKAGTKVAHSSQVREELVFRVRRACVSIVFLRQATHLRSLLWSRTLTRQQHDERMKEAQNQWRTKLSQVIPGDQDNQLEPAEEDKDLEFLLSLIRKRLERDPALALVICQLMEEFHEKQSRD